MPYSIPILTIVVVGYLTKYVPARAAKIALASGVGLYIFSQFILKPLIGADGYPHFLHVMAILFVLNTLIMLAIGRSSPREEPFVLKDTGAVDLARMVAREARRYGYRRCGRFDLHCVRMM